MLLLRQFIESLQLASHEILIDQVFVGVVDFASKGSPWESKACNGK